MVAGIHTNRKSAIYKHCISIVRAVIRVSFVLQPGIAVCLPAARMKYNPCVSVDSKVDSLKILPE